jgi:hypothetical protein
MNAQSITAIPIPERRSIKRIAHLFTLLACLAIGGLIVYWFAGGVDTWFWLLTTAALVLLSTAALAWRFERPKSTLLIGGATDSFDRRIE